MEERVLLGDGWWNVCGGGVEVILDARHSKKPRKMPKASWPSEWEVVYFPFLLTPGTPSPCIFMSTVLPRGTRMFARSLLLLDHFGG